MVEADGVRRGSAGRWSILAISGRRLLGAFVDRGKEKEGGKEKGCLEWLENLTVAGQGVAGKEKGVPVHDSPHLRPGPRVGGILGQSDAKVR